MPRRMMEKSFLLVISVNVSVAAAIYFANTVSHDEPVTASMRVATFNTEYWHIPEKQMLDAIGFEEVDIVFLQEHLEKRGKVWGPTNRIAELKAAVPGRYVDWNGEVVTVSKWPIIGRRAFSGGEALRTDLKAPNGRIISAYNIHLPVHIHPGLLRNPVVFFKDASSIAARREFLLNEVIGDLTSNRNAIVVAGDFNSSPAMNGIGWFRRSMIDAFNAPQCDEARDTFEMAGGLLGWRIDYVYVSAHFLPQRYCTKSRSDISDHSAIIADLAFSTGESNPTAIIDK